jgi:formylglycine-generating enzyme required for sulfatase activity
VYRPYRRDEARPKDNSLAPVLRGEGWGEGPSDDGRDDPAALGRRVVRGGSWYDRPKRCTSSFRLAYEPYEPVFNVGFRVIAEEE